MIQRIQTIWLLLCASCAGLTFLLPFGTNNNVSEVGTESVMGEPMTAKTHTIVAIFAICIIACSFIAIFSYKNRAVQKLFGLITILQTLVGLAFMIYVAGFQTEHTSIQYGIIIPFFAFIFSILALKAIRKDEKLIKNLDRLR